MSDPVLINFELKEGLPKDLQLMSIWAQSFEYFKNDMTKAETQAAVTWFVSYLKHNHKGTRND